MWSSIFVVVCLWKRWFDKSFSVVFYKNGKSGLNGEHSWGDAPVLSHLWEVRTHKKKMGSGCSYLSWKADIHVFLVSIQYTLATECFQLGYNAEGHCKGEVDTSLPKPQKLNWEIPSEVSFYALTSETTEIRMLIIKNITSLEVLQLSNKLKMFKM